MAEQLEIGDWKKISDLGRGSFGVVSLWKNQITGETIAIKKCQLSRTTPNQARRWNNEVSIMRQINSRNVVQFKQLPEALLNGIKNPSGLPLLSMEYCKRGNLRHVMKNPHNICGLEEFDIKEILADLSNGLKYLHSLNITHRDIKPENVVLQECTGRPSKNIYKLIDLGFAKELENTLSVVGTCDYVAPEILNNVKDYNKSVDYWSFGILVYEIICGCHPFLHQATFTERFKYIETKKPQDICIYRDYKTHQVKYSSEIIQKCHISSCLKRNLEKWLQSVLEYDYKIRGRVDKSEGLDVFDKLHLALRKQIVTVFSVYSYEFYYYEFDEYTKLETFQNWIARDTKIEIPSQILLADKTIWDPNNPFIYVFKAGAFLKEKHRLMTPTFLADLETKLDYPRFCRDSYFYVSQERKYMQALVNSCALFENYIKRYCDKAEKQLQVLKRLSVHIDAKETKKTAIEDNDMLETYLQKISAVQESCNNLKKHRNAWFSLCKDVNFLFNNYSQNNVRNDAIRLFKPPNGPIKETKNRNKNVLAVVMEVIKQRDTALGSPEFNAYCSLSALLTKHVTTLLPELKELIETVNNNGVCLNGPTKSKGSYYRIEDSYSTQKLIDENMSLQNQLAELITGCLSQHKLKSDNLNLII